MLIQWKLFENCFEQLLCFIIASSGKSTSKADHIIKINYKLGEIQNAKWEKKKLPILHIEFFWFAVLC